MSARPQSVRGRCLLCGKTSTLHVHVSRADGLPRLACAPCWSKATLADEAGTTVDWLPGHTEEAVPVEDGLW
ncbi:hypothetical protein [Embleya sp. NPDC001921]